MNDGPDSDTTMDTRALWVDVVDNMWDMIGWANINDEQIDWLEKHIEQPVRDLLCIVNGEHEVVDDQCDHPEHRFCVVCGRRKPHTAVSA